MPRASCDPSLSGSNIGINLLYRKNVLEGAEETSEASSRSLPRNFGIRATGPSLQIYLIHLQLQANVAGGLSIPQPSSPSDVHDVRQPWYSFP